MSAKPEEVGEQASLPGNQLELQKAVRSSYLFIAGSGAKASYLPIYESFS